MNAEKESDMKIGLNGKRTRKDTNSSSQPSTVFHFNISLYHQQAAYSSNKMIIEKT